MIPRQIAFFWAEERMSWMRYLTLLSFRKLNPDWPISLYVSSEYRLCGEWGIESQDWHGEIGKDYRNQLEKLNIKIEKWTPPRLARGSDPVKQSDVFQWWYLYEIGGFYADMDILWVHSCAQLYDKISKYEVVLSITDWGFPIGFLAGVAETRLYKHVLDKAILRAGESSYQSSGVHAVYEALKLSRDNIRGAKESLKARYNERIYNLKPKESVYPFSWKEVGKIFSTRLKLENDELGIHWFGGSKVAQSYNRLLNDSNWHKHRNTFTKHVRDIV